MADNESSGERLALTIDLSEVAREIGEGAGAPWVFDAPDDLADKARLYALPLQLVHGR